MSLSTKLYTKYKKVLNTPDLITKNTNTKKLHSVTWYNKGGLNGIELRFTKKFKWHPYPAPVVVYAFKYINVPEHLIGPLKYASETIKIDEIDVPYKYSKKYHSTGKKQVAKVSGSCASIIISAMTIKFVEDMIKKYKKVSINSQEFKKLYQLFRETYDSRIKMYIDTSQIKPEIPWLNKKYTTL